MRQISTEKIVAITFGVLVLCFAAISISFAVWQTPIGTPPANNVAAPLNVGVTGQVKAGQLGLGGITTLNPNSMLEVMGYVIIDQPNFPNRYTAFARGANGLNIQPSADNTAAIKFNNAAGNATIMDIDTINKRVGINTGTTAPTTSLHVVGDARITGLTSCGVITTDSNGNLSCGTASTGLWTDAGTYIYPNNLNGGEKFAITDTGNLGIGTISPSTKLDVNGTIRIEAAGSGTYSNAGHTIDADMCLRASNSTGLAYWGTCAATGPQGPQGPAGPQGPGVPNTVQCVYGDKGYSKGVQCRVGNCNVGYTSTTYICGDGGWAIQPTQTCYSSPCPCLSINPC